MTEGHGERHVGDGVTEEEQQGINKNGKKSKQTF